MWTDFQQALRSLAQGRNVVVLCVLCLGLGIGVVTTVVAVVNAVVLQPVPFRDPGALLQITVASPDTAGAASPVSFRSFELWRRQPMGAELAAVRAVQVATRHGAATQRRAGMAVTWNAFGVLGVNPIAGRPFREDEDRAGGPAVVMIGEAFWASAFSADPDVVGQHVAVNDRDATIVGVVPRFTHPGLPGAWRAADIWMPLAAIESPDSDDRTLTVMARAPQGERRAAVSTSLAAQLEAVAGADRANRDLTVHVTPLDVSVSPMTRAMLLTAAGAAVFVLLIACANVANLLLLRSTVRQREMATRLALGASRWRVARQLFLESALVGLAGAPVGLLCGWLGRNWLLSAAAGTGSPMPAIDVRVLAAGIVVSLITSVLFGIAPAVQSMRASPRELLGDAGRPATPGRSSHRLRVAFAASEIVLSLVLLVSASLLARSFVNLLDVDRDLDLTRIVVVGLRSPEERQGTPAETARVTDEIREQVGALPAVTSVALSEFMPLRGGGPRVNIGTAGEAPPARERVARRNGVSARFFETMGIALEDGRSFTETEARAGDPVVVVNRRLADYLWPGEGAVGRRIRLDSDSAALHTVIGVSRNISNWDISGVPLPTAYVPLAPHQEARRVLVFRTAGDPAAVMPVARDLVGSFDRTPRGAEPMTLETVSRDAFFRQRTLAALFGVFSVLALLLTAVGLFGVLAYFVSQRRRELGIRAALGATRRNLIWLVGRQTLMIAAAGIACGVPLALAATRVLQGLLFEVRATDPVSFNGTAIFLLIISALASWVPAVRAASTDPAVSLRDM